MILSSNPDRQLRFSSRMLSFVSCFPFFDAAFTIVEMTQETDSDFVSHSLLQLTRCPATKSKLEQASADLVTQLNKKFDDGELADQLGRPIQSPLAGGFVNADQSLFYPACSGIVKLVIGDAIKL